MKKVILLIFVIGIIFSMTACARKNYNTYTGYGYSTVTIPPFKANINKLYIIHWSPGGLPAINGYMIIYSLGEPYCTKMNRIPFSGVIDKNHVKLAFERAQMEGHMKADGKFIGYFMFNDGSSEAQSFRQLKSDKVVNKLLLKKSEFDKKLLSSLGANTSDCQQPVFKFRDIR